MSRPEVSREQFAALYQHYGRVRPVCRLLHIADSTGYLLRRELGLHTPKRSRNHNPTGRCQRQGPDLLSKAERTLYPGVPYHAMTPAQRVACARLAYGWAFPEKRNKAGPG